MADRGGGFGQHRVGAGLLGKRGDVAKGIEAFRRLVERQMPVQSQPQDAKVDGSARLQRRCHPLTLRDRIRRVAADSDPTLRRHRQGAAHRALQVVGAARRIVGAGTPAHSSSWM